LFLLFPWTQGIWNFVVEEAILEEEQIIYLLCPSSHKENSSFALIQARNSTNQPACPNQNGIAPASPHFWRS
jgi:hypothetical protein